MGEGGGGEEFLSFSSLSFSLPSFPFSPETPDTQAKQARKALANTIHVKKSNERCAFMPKVIA